MDRTLIDTVKVPGITSRLEQLESLSKHAGFKKVIPMINLDNDWLFPVSGYVAKFDLSDRFVAEPFIIKMFRGVMIKFFRNASFKSSQVEINRRQLILNGSIRDKAIRPYDPDDDDGKVWTPSLGPKPSFIGIYKTNYKDNEYCIIVDSGLDESVETKLHEYFVTCEEKGMTYLDVFSSKFIAKIRRYSAENRSRLLSIATHVLRLESPKNPTTRIDPLSSLNVYDGHESTKKKLATGLAAYMSKEGGKSYIVSGFKFPDKFPSGYDEEIKKMLQGFEFGSTLTSMRNCDPQGFKKLIELSVSRLNRNGFELLDTDIVTSNTMVDGAASIQYSYVICKSGHGVFFSNAFSTLDSRSLIIVRDIPIRNIKMYIVGSKEISGSSIWKNKFMNGFHASLPMTGTYLHASTQDRNKIVCEGDINDQKDITVEVKRPISKVEEELGFVDSSENLSTTFTTFLVKISSIL